MTDDARPRGDAGTGGDPWAPPEHKESYDGRASGQPVPLGKGGATPPAQPPAAGGAAWQPPGPDVNAGRPPVQDRPPSVHDQPTMAAMPAADGSVPPGFAPPGSVPPGSVPPHAPAGFAPPMGGGPSAVPPPPAAPADPAAAYPGDPGGYGYPGQPGYPGQAGYPGQPGYPGYPGQSGYPGYPGPQGYGWPGMPMSPQNGFGVAAMVLGILSICLFCLYGVVSLVLGILAVVFGVKGRKRVERGEADNHGQAQAGFIMGIIGIVLGIAVLVLLGIGIGAAISDYDDYDSDPYVGDALGVSAPAFPISPESSGAHEAPASPRG
ncbi:DUF4190 domain-containing protein [Streptomyces sp. NPDC059785]|uniref:DUF4190 domain-containing protein n=1 Tax=unclassified Streptomyces TaxID=2593676 RepID=UPI00365A2A21